MQTFDTQIQPLFLGPHLDTHADPGPNLQVSHTNPNLKTSWCANIQTESIT